MELKAQRKSGGEWNSETTCQNDSAREFWSWGRKDNFDLPYLFTTFGFSPQFGSTFREREEGRKVSKTSIQVLKASNYFRAPWQAQHQTMKEIGRMILVHVPMICLQPGLKGCGSG